MKTVTYEEAGKILGVKTGTVRAAANRAHSLTRVPVTGQTQMLIEEQVKLFIGKKQIRKTMLSKEELAAWERYEKGVTQHAQETPQSATPTPSVTNILQVDANELVRVLEANNIPLLLTIGKNQRPFSSARMVPQR